MQLSLILTVLCALMLAKESMAGTFFFNPRGMNEKVLSGQRYDFIIVDTNIHHESVVEGKQQEPQPDTNMLLSFFSANTKG